MGAALSFSCHYPLNHTLMEEMTSVCEPEEFPYDQQNIHSTQFNMQ